jgi:hypothetical protein
MPYTLPLAALERWIEVNESDRLILDITLENVQVVAVVKKILGHNFSL